MTKCAFTIYCGFYVVLLFPLLAHANATSTRADLLFNWAEAMVPTTLTSTHHSQTLLDYYYRGPYPQVSGSAFYLGVTHDVNPHVIILDTGNDIGITSLGLVSDWITTVSYTNTATLTNTQVTDCTALYTLDSGEQTQSEQSLSSDATDTSGICTKNTAGLTLNNTHITTSGNSSSLENSHFYGLNAVILALSGSNITLSGGSITSTGSGANGAFATGVGSTISLQDTTLSVMGQGGSSVKATLGGSLALMNVTAHSTGANGAVIATDYGGGTITVSGGNFVAEGTDSVGVYSTGLITIAGATVTATQGEAVVVESGSAVVMSRCNVFASQGTHDSGMRMEPRLFGKTDNDVGSLTLNGGSYIWSSATGAAFYVANTAAAITLNAVVLNNSANVLLKVAADNETDGGTVTFNANAQTLSGDVIADRMSSIDINLSNDSHLTGAINSDNTAKSATLTLNADSTWNLTADSYLSHLTASTVSNIVGNGHNIYYQQGTADNEIWQPGSVYDLVGGGKLIPSNTVSTLSTGCGLSATTGHRYESISSSGEQRQYYLSIPEDYDPNKGYGLVFGYHGRDYDGQRMRDYLQLEETPQAGNALFVYPDGLSRYWEEFRMSAIGWFLNPYDNQDFVLFDDILAEMESHFCIDTSRVYVTGQSWGGDMSSALACARGNKVAAAVAVGVNGDFFFTGRADFPDLYPVLTFSDCQRPVPMITYRGEDDTLEGGKSSDWWYGVNQCQQPAGNATKENIVQNGYYADQGCLVPNIFVRYSNGGGAWNDHQIPDEFEDETMDFFQQHVLP